MFRIVEKTLAVSILLSGYVRGELSYQPIAPGIERAQTTIRSSPDADPATVWIYRPAAKIPAHSLPAVFIAPGGLNLMLGQRLVADDAAEHLPYVKQGFVVVAYDVDGELPPDKNAALTPADIQQRFLRAVAAYVKADGGLANLRATISSAQAAEPAIDSTRLYVAGHGMAGGLALRAAGSLDAIRGVVAYAAVTDLHSQCDPDTLAAIEPSAPGISDLLLKRQPLSQVASMKVPVMLFHATDDENVPIEPIRAYAAALKAAGNEPLVNEVPRGGHYQSMLLQGLDAGATWLADRAKRDATTKPAK